MRESLEQHLRVVGQMVLGNPVVAAQGQRAPQGGRIRATYLPRLDWFAGRDQFVAGTHDQDARLDAYVGPRQARGGDHCEFRRAEESASGEQQVALAAVEAAGVDVAEWFGDDVGIHVRPAVGRRDALNRNHAIAAGRQHGAGHHLEARSRGKRLGTLAGGLRASDAEPTLTRAPVLARDGDAVHRDPVERRLVALGPHGLREHGPRQSGERARLDRQRAHVPPDQRLGFGRCGEGLHRVPVPRAYFFCASV